MNRKKIILTILIAILVLTVGGIYYIFVIDSPSRIAINDIEEHIKYQDNHSKTLTLFQYEKILRENPQSTYANYYVARLIRDDDENRALLLSKKGISLDTNFGYNYSHISR
jgi:flagellar basal body-associated protein FliL